MKNQELHSCLTPGKIIGSLALVLFATWSSIALSNDTSIIDGIINDIGYQVNGGAGAQVAPGLMLQKNAVDEVIDPRDYLREVFKKPKSWMEYREIAFEAIRMADGTDELFDPFKKALRRCVELVDAVNTYAGPNRSSIDVRLKGFFDDHNQREGCFKYAIRIVDTAEIYSNDGAYVTGYNKYPAIVFAYEMAMRFHRLFRDAAFDHTAQALTLVVMTSNLVKDLELVPERTQVLPLLQKLNAVLAGETVQRILQDIRGREAMQLITNPETGVTDLVETGIVPFQIPLQLSTRLNSEVFDLLTIDLAQILVNLGHVSDTQVPDIGGGLNVPYLKRGGK